MVQTRTDYAISKWWEITQQELHNSKQARNMSKFVKMASDKNGGWAHEHRRWPFPSQRIQNKTIIMNINLHYM